MLNYFEENTIRNEKLPQEWQSLNSLNEFESFLQTNWEERYSFYKDESYSTKQQFLSFYKNSIRTNNYVGTIVFKGKQLNIFPKIFKYEKDDNDKSELTLSHLLMNLAIWVEYCNKVDYPYISIKSEVQRIDNLKELFITLFIKYLKVAIERSAYYQYENITEDCNTIKGTFNVGDYYTRKIPNGNIGKFECTFSNFEFDNLLNKIIKTTCKQILLDTSPQNQKELRRIIAKFNDVTDAKCVPSDCGKIHLSRMNRHYKIIVSMCKIFLLNKNTSYHLDKTESFCFLFPTEILFEGFIGGYLQSIIGDRGIVKLQVSDKKLIDDVIYGGVSYGSITNMRHDIVVQIKDKGMFILDTKYKELHRFGDYLSMENIRKEVNSNDLYQMYTYALTRGLKNAYLLYPLFREEDLEPDFPSLLIPVVINGVEHHINVHLIRLPFVFEKDNERTKNNLSKVLESIIA